ncbi:MAG: hypothetical protein ACRDPD_21580, partial [Streptosporangiaceae bacterium]
FRWSGAARARPGDDGLALTVTLPAGGHHDLVLELSDRPLAASRPTRTGPGPPPRKPGPPWCPRATT